MTSRAVLCLLLLTSLAMADTRSEVDRLFMQASSGEIKYQSVVQPSKDSLIAMADSAAKYLVDKLKSTDARERHTLVDIYKGIGTVATPYLLDAIDTENKDQLRSSLLCLAEVKDSVALPKLLEAAAFPDYTIRSEALTAIGKTGGDQTLAAEVATFMTDSVSWVRKSCVVALGRIHSPTSIPTLAAALGDSYFGARLCAYDALVKYDTLAYSEISGLIGSATSDRTKALAVKLSGQLEIRDAASAVRPLLSADDDLVRGWAVWSWGRIRGALALVDLESIREQETDPFVKSQIAATIEYLRVKPVDE